ERATRARGDASGRIQAAGEVPIRPARGELEEHGDHESHGISQTDGRGPGVSGRRAAGGDVQPAAEEYDEGIGRYLDHHADAARSGARDDGTGGETRPVLSRRPGHG